MSFKKLKAYFRLSRPINVAITFVSIPVACWIAGGTLRQRILIILAALTGALVTAGANAINDFFDIEIDRINRPDRPLPRGEIPRQEARLMWFITSMAAIGLNIFVNPTALLIVIISIVLLFFYSAQLKGTILVGNIVVGLMTGMAFIYGGIVVGGVNRAIMPAIFAFLANLARELIKDVEDIEGDRAQNIITLAIKYGTRPALALATASLVFLIGSTFIAAYLAVYHLVFLYSLLAADFLMLGVIGMIWRDSSTARMRLVSNILKICMVIGLLSIIAGSL